MEPAVADTIARATRDEASQRAQEDLGELRRRAIEAARQRSRDLVKVTTINYTTGAMRHNPAGRILRDWYLHVYLNDLRRRLGQPSETIGAQEIEDTAALLRHVRPASESISSLKATAVVRAIAVGDAAESAVKITGKLRDVGEIRAVRHASVERFDGDELRVQVVRHWYKRCYDDAVDAALGVRHPLAAVTDAEETQVSRTLASREVRRLIGRDGIPLVTAFGTAMTDLDRRLAAGESGLVPAWPGEARAGAPWETLELRVRGAWGAMEIEERMYWLRSARAPGIEGGIAWNDLRAEQQMLLVRHYLSIHRRELMSVNFDRRLIAGSEADQARKMFNHSESLKSTTWEGAGIGTAQTDEDGTLTRGKASGRSL